MEKLSMILLAAALAAPPAATQARLNGAGATFPNLIYRNWVISYNQKSKDVQLNYQSIGPGRRHPPVL